MSATETIRAMLDERGVEWVDTGDGSTLIPAQAATNVAWDVNTWPSGKDIGGCLWVQNRHPLTPEQAIEATLGRGECKDIGRLEEENAKLRELVRELYDELDAATQYDAGGGRGVVHEMAYRMRELGVEV